MTRPTPIRRDDFEDEAPDERDLSQPPHSAQAESAVLGSILKNQRAIAEVSSELRPEDFYAERNRLVYAAMLKLFERGVEVDYHTVGDELARLGTYERSGGTLNLTDIDITTPSAAHIRHYAEIVRRYAFCRRAIQIGQQIAEMAYKADLDEEGLAARMSGLVLSAASRSASRRLIYADELASRYMDRLGQIEEAGSMGVSTGLIDLDQITLGLAPGSLILLCGRPGTGKSELAGQIALDVGRGKPASNTRCQAGKGWTLHVSIEMSEEELAERAASGLSGVDKIRLLRGHMNQVETDKLTESLNVISESRCAFAVETGLTSSDVRALALQLEAAKGPLDLVVVDYIQLLKDKLSPNSNTADDLGVAANGLKGLAKALNCCVLAPTQLSRAVDMRSDKRPLLSDIRSSGELEQACDIMIAMYRDDMYYPDTDAKGVTELINRKHRRYGPLRGNVAQVLYARTRYLDLEVFRG